MFVLAAVALAATPVGAAGAFDLSWPTARAAGLAGADVGLTPAPPDSAKGVRGLTVDRIEISGGELYGLPEAGGLLVRGTVGSRLGSATLTVGQLGGSLYRERTLGVALARPLRRMLVAEVGWRVLSLGAAEVPTRTTMAFDAGLAARLLGRIVLAAAWRNVGDARIGGSPVSAGASLRAALLLDEISLAGLLELDPAHGSSFAVGSEASVNEWLRVRVGVALDPGTLGAGIGIGRERGGADGRRATLLAWPAVDLAVTWHPDLGGSSFATITFHR